MNWPKNLGNPPQGDIGHEPPTTGPPTAELPALRPGVLIVDDQEDVRGVVGLGLRHHGFTVWLAGDAEEAVEVYRAHQASIGIVLLDVQMPGRDGPRTLMDIRAVNPDVVACFMTGNAGHYTQQNLLDLGASAIIQKPFRMGELAIQLATLTTPIGVSDGLPEVYWGNGGGQIIGST